MKHKCLLDSGQKDRKWTVGQWIIMHNLFICKLLYSLICHKIHHLWNPLSMKSCCSPPSRASSQAYSGIEKFLILKRFWLGYHLTPAITQHLTENTASIRPIQLTANLCDFIKFASHQFLKVLINFWGGFFRRNLPYASQ